MAYDNTNSGVLFTNDKKQKQTHPDFKGNINIGGVDYWLSAWNKQGQKGAFISLSVQPKDAKPVSEHSKAKADAYVKDNSLRPDSDFLNEEVPF